MIRRLTLSLLTLFLFCGAAFAEDVYIEGPTGRFRSGPGTEYGVLWEAVRYTPLEYLARYKDWYVVRDYEGDVGWVHEQVVGKGRAAIVINKKANIRKGPGTQYPVVFSVEERYLFKVLDEKQGWFKVVDAEGDEGWVYSPLVWVSR